MTSPSKRAKRAKIKAPEPVANGVTTKASPAPTEPALLALLACSLVLLSVRIHAARQVGFGDSEALYASYAIHPAPAYLDHPGLVGQLARLLAGDGAPTPYGTHAVTAALATALPWLVLAVARMLGASRRASALTGLFVALVPETAVGLFALTPDLPLAFAWLGAVGFAAAGLGCKPASARAASAFLAAGLLAGVATAAKATGLLLLVSLALGYATARGEARQHRKTLWPWLGLLTAAVVLAPIFSFEAKLGWPMLTHRLIHTQGGSGFSIRNLAATLGGQFAYLSPVVFAVAAIVARDLFKRRHEDAASGLLFTTFAVPFAALLAFCLWSRVAEPHWLAPPLLGLSLHAARRGPHLPPWPRKLVVWAMSSAAAFTAIAHVYVLAPDAARLWPASFDPKADIASELYGWPDALRAAEEAAQELRIGDANSAKNIWFIGPHWVICAQLQAGLPSSQVGCSQEHTDFDTWGPRAQWEKADALVYVTDARFSEPQYDTAKLFPSFARTGSRHVTVMRAGRVSRAFRVLVLDRRPGA